MNTTLLLPRFTRGTAPDSRTLARLIAHDVGKPLSWEFNKHSSVNEHLLMVDLGDADPKRVSASCRRRLDEHGIDWEVHS